MSANNRTREPRVRRAPLRAGFTMIEMLSVAVIVGILAMIAIPAIYSSREQAAASACNANRKLILTAIANYKLRTGAKVDASTDPKALLGALDRGGYLTPVPVDALTGEPYRITFQAVNDGAASGAPPATKVTVTCPNPGDACHGSDSALM